MAIGTQFGFALAGFAPTIAAAIAGTGSDSWLGVSIFIAVLCLINVAAVGDRTRNLQGSHRGSRREAGKDLIGARGGLRLITEPEAGKLTPRSLTAGA